MLLPVLKMLLAPTLAEEDAELEAEAQAEIRPASPLHSIGSQNGRAHQDQDSLHVENDFLRQSPHAKRY